MNEEKVLIDGVIFNRYKICKTCGEELPREKFSKRDKSADKLQHSCKECQKKSKTKKHLGKTPAQKKYSDLVSRKIRGDLNAEIFMTEDELISWWESNESQCFLTEVTLEESEDLLSMMRDYRGDSKLINSINKKLGKRLMNMEGLMLKRIDVDKPYQIDNLMFITPIVFKLWNYDHDIEFKKKTSREVVVRIKQELGVEDKVEDTSTVVNGFFV